eukprot:2207770-Amphidinium_carterae.1
MTSCDINLDISKYLNSSLKEVLTAITAELPTLFVSIDLAILFGPAYAWTLNFCESIPFNMQDKMPDLSNMVKQWHTANGSNIHQHGARKRAGGTK